MGKASAVFRHLGRVSVHGLSLDLLTSADLMLTPQFSATRALLRAGLLSPSATLFEDLGALSILGCTGISPQPGSSAARAGPWHGPCWTQGFCMTPVVSRAAPGEPCNDPLFQGPHHSPLSEGGQGFSCLMVVKNGGTVPPLRHLPGSINTSQLPSAFPPTCWSTLLL